MHLLRDLAPQVLAAVTRRHVDFAAAEDGVQEALIAAAEQWPQTGVPSNPRGWLYHVALRRMTDQIRSDVARARREEQVAQEAWASWAFVPPADAELQREDDDTLALLFMCCHPSLSSASAIALTLRAVGGLTTREIASAFLVPESTMAQRISRAKQSIRASGIPFELPDSGDRASRLGAVLHVLYLIFNEGYVSSAGADLHRPDLATEAIRLMRMLADLARDEPEVDGLLALMLLTDARRLARSGPAGELIPLDRQHRGLWNRVQIAEGIARLEKALGRGAAGPYQLQAAIAALHDEAASAEETDWPQILALYERLETITPNPIVSLNRAVAVAMVHGARSGLELVDTLAQDARVAQHYRLDATRAHLLERLGDRSAAVEHYRRAARRTASIPERDYLLLKAATIESEVEAVAGGTEVPRPA
jgi:RNA polymerase sigma factor (sigma-70 family)